MDAPKRKLTFSPAEDVMRRLTRTFVLGLLQSWTAEDLSWAINNNVMLASLLKTDPQKYNYLRNIGRKVPRWAQAFTYEYVIEWFSDNRPDFAGVLRTSAGRNWLEQNIEALRRSVWEDDLGVLTPSEMQSLLELKDKFLAENPE